jgi:hypothetical protein
MSKFTFALPNGLLFTLDGPPGATVAQAEKIYLEQLAAGAFVGLRPGDQLQSIESTLIEFTQSRLKRGTAGVPDIPLLALYNNGALAGVTGSSNGSPFGGGSGGGSGSNASNASNANNANNNNYETDVPLLVIYKNNSTANINNAVGAPTNNQLIISSLPVLTTVPINNGIDVADYVDQSTVTESIGPLSTTQVQAVLAAVAASVCQPADVASDELGVGKYGLSVQQLEDAGYLKCGTTARFLGNAQ